MTLLSKVDNSLRDKQEVWKCQSFNFQQTVFINKYQKNKRQIDHVPVCSTIYIQIYTHDVCSCECVCMRVCMYIYTTHSIPSIKKIRCT